MKLSEIQELLKSMSLTEKIDQLVQLNGEFFDGTDHLTGPAAEFNLAKERPYNTGSVLGEHGAENIRRLQDKFTELQPHHIPALFMSDVIHGYRTAFPVPIAQGCSFNPKLTEELCAATAKEAAAGGVHVTFSPMADLSRDSRWGRCMESTGEDPWLNARLAESMVKGFQGEKCGDKWHIAACVKHFAAYGAVQSGRDYNVTELSERTLRDDYLPAYKAAIDAGVAMVMTAFNTIDRIPCTINKHLMRDILRGEMGFEGVLISDYNAVGEAVIHSAAEDKSEAAQKAIEAGCDIDMLSDCYINHLEKLVLDGKISEKLIDEAVMRVLVLKNDLGLFENPYKDGSPEAEKEILFCKEHRELSRKAAEESIVMLKNSGILPLDKKQKIAVVGTLADSRDITGSWAIFVDKNETVTFKQALNELYPDADIRFILSDNADDDMIAAAKDSDIVVLVLGEDQTFSGESCSKADISLPDHQRKLFDKISEVNENIVTVLFGGRPLAIPHEAEKSAAVIMAWLPGSCGSYALADILFGAVNPSGKLSMSFPYCTGQLPISYSAFSTGRPKLPEWEGFIPYHSNYMDCPNIPLYPFGFGLSYTDYEYSPVVLSDNTLRRGGKITASVTVKNNGNIDGLEAVQLYIRDIKGSVVRPMRELKGAQKIHLKAGEEKTVSFEITEDMLKFYDINMDHTAENGDFTVWIGGSSLTSNSADFILI